MTRPTLSQSWGSYPAFNLVYFVLLTTSPQPMAGVGRHGWESAAFWPARRQGAPSLPQIFLQTGCWPDSTSPPFPWPLRSYPRRLGTHPAGWPAERKEGRGETEVGEGVVPCLPEDWAREHRSGKNPGKRRHAGCRNVSSFPPTCFTSPHTEHDSLSENDMLRSESQPWTGNGSLQRSLFLPPHSQQRVSRGAAETGGENPDKSFHAGEMEEATRVTVVLCLYLILSGR